MAKQNSETVVAIRLLMIFSAAVTRGVREIESPTANSETQARFDRIASNMTALARGLGARGWETYSYLDFACFLTMVGEDEG